MSQTNGTKVNSIHASTEILNFQLAVPNSISSTSILTTKEEHGDSEKPDSEQRYLETEIDSYSGVDFSNKKSLPLVRPSTPPKSTMRAFTFGSTNPFAISLEKPRHDDALYTTISKPKIRPKVPPKPSPRDIEAKAKEIRDSSMRLSTTSLFNTPIELTGTLKKVADTNDIQRVSSLPNLAPMQLTKVGSRQQKPDIECCVNNEHGMNDESSPSASPRPLQLLNSSSKNVDYCDMIPESPPYLLPRDPENIYEDIKINGTSPSALSQEKISPPIFVSELLSDTRLDEDYTEMSSPQSEVNFSYNSIPIYENIPVDSFSNEMGAYQDGSIDPIGILEPPLQFTSSKSAVHQIIPEANRPPHNYDYNKSRSQYYANTEDTNGVSPTSSFTDRSCSSVASTVASSFQGVKVCYFPPSPPKEFYSDFNTCGLPEVLANNHKRPGSISTFSIVSQTSSNASRQSSSRPSRSRIPVPVKSLSTPENPHHSSIAVPEELAPPPPLTPTPSPVLALKNKKKVNKQDIKLSPPSPPAGKSARWYEKLGCIQSDTIQPAEPYGVPGERKRSKSLNKEHRRSKFFVPIDKNNDVLETSTHIAKAE